VKRKRGLVLEGGGAKGAYAFAFIRTLHRSGVTFDVVAGTSVGALNAVIWATEDFEEATKLWETISLKRVFPFRLPRFLAYSFLPLVLVYHCYCRFNSGLPPLHENQESLRNSLFRIAFTLLNELPMLFLFGALTLNLPLLHLGGDVPLYVRAICFVGLLFLVWVPFAIVYSKADLEGVENFLRVSIFGVYAVGGVILALTWIFIAPIKTVLVIVGLVGLWYLPPILQKMSILSPTPLRNHVTHFLQHPLRINTYVTTAVESQIFDPADPTWCPIIRGPDELPIYIAGTKAVHIPRYLLLNSMNREDAILACMASAALPFGTVPPVVVNGEESVDGGLADNLPCHPLIRDEHCELLIVVCLSPEAEHRPKNFYAQEWRRIERLQKLVDFEPPTGEFLRIPKTYAQVSVEEPEFWPEIVTHYPKRPLGGLLDFSRRHMHELMEWGQDDAREFLSRNPQLLSAQILL
jgi:predicted acylesterase/phospholipase RssA